jgi:hypothetical protein
VRHCSTSTRPGTEAALGENLIEKGQRGRFIRANRHAFAGGETVEFQHGRVFSGDGAKRFFQRVGGVARAVGMPFRTRNCFANSLLASSCADSFGGPQQGMPLRLAKIRQPLAFHQIAFLTGDAEVDGVAFIQATSDSRPSASTGLAISKIASLPGKQNNSGFPGDSASALTSACSRPPLPTTRILIRQRFSRNPAKTQHRIQGVVSTPRALPGYGDFVDAVPLISWTLVEASRRNE